MDKTRGGDGDAIDVLLIAQHLPTGTVIDIIPIGVIVLNDSGEIDNKIIAVPFDQRLRIVDVES